MTDRDFHVIDAAVDRNQGGSYETLVTDVLALLEEHTRELAETAIVKCSCVDCRREYYTIAGHTLGCPWCRVRAGNPLEHCRVCLGPSAVYADALCRSCFGERYVAMETGR